MKEMSGLVASGTLCISGVHRISNTVGATTKF